MTDFEPEYPQAASGGAAGQPGSPQGYPPLPQTSQQQGYAQTDYRQQYGNPQGYQQQGYGPPPYGRPPIRSTNTMAVLAIVFAFVFAPLGIVFGVMARNQIQQTGEDGAGLALAGIIVGAVATALSVLVIFLALVVLGTAANTINDIDFTNFPTPT